MKELLDDNFELDAYTSELSAEERVLLKDKVPYLILQGETLADVCSLLEGAAIDFNLQRQQGSANGTGIIPLAATQLDMVDTLIYIPLKDKDEVDELVANYESNRSTEKKEVSTGKFKLFYLVAAVFLFIVLVCTYYLYSHNSNQM